MTNVDLGPRKTAFIMIVVVGCFAVLWPKVFYPMYAGSTQNSPMKSHDKSAGCCDVIWETDINAIKIMTDLCGHILEDVRNSDPRVQLAFESGGKLPKEVIEKCRAKVLATCNVDIAVFLKDNIKLGRSYRQILDELRSTNSSLCLKYNFGVTPDAIGFRHLGLGGKKIQDVRQERPAHLRPDMLHPALRERGRMIPPSSALPPSPSIPVSMPRQQQPQPRVVPGRPGPVPGMRPTIGGPGHVVQPKQSTSTMGIVMPIYTIGIVIFFTYTLMKVRANREDLSLKYSSKDNEDSDSETRRPKRDDSPENMSMMFKSSATRAAQRKLRNYKKLMWVQKELEELCNQDIIVPVNKTQ